MQFGQGSLKRKSKGKAQNAKVKVAYPEKQCGAYIKRSVCAPFWDFRADRPSRKSPAAYCSSQHPAQTQHHHRQHYGKYGRHQQVPGAGSGAGPFTGKEAEEI